MYGRITTFILLGVVTGVMAAMPHTTQIQKNATIEHPYKHYNKEKLDMVKRICNSTHSICPHTLKSRSLCTVRLNGDKREYRDYKDDCFRNVDNICNQPNNEFIIVQSGSCEDYLNARRADAATVVPKKGTTIKKTTMARIYSQEFSWDGVELCHYSCTNVYKPECLQVNSGNGMIKKYYTFLNHCQAVVYYCKHRSEFDPPKGYEDWPLDVQHSNLDKELCGSIRYLQFARFSETASSLGHYGWLRGDQNYRHIMNGD